VEAERYARHNNGHILDDGHYCETGRPHRRTRPALVEALRRAKDADALVLIHQFEPLSGDAVFLGLLWESGVEFVAGDNEYANRTTLPLLASLVIKRSRETSARAEKAWAKRRRRKSLGSLGTPGNLTPEARRRGGEATRSRYGSLVSDKLHEQLLAWRAEGRSLRQIAATLYNQGHRSETGRPWSHTHIRRLLARCDEVEQRRAAVRAGQEAKVAATRRDDLRAVVASRGTSKP
jgi:hypothetical protein